jgi:hypothetical protein
MVRYYGFLANRKRGSLLPKVYEAPVDDAAQKTTTAGVCSADESAPGHRPVSVHPVQGPTAFCRAMAGEHATKMLSDRLNRMAKKRWLQTPTLDKFD